MADCGSFTVEAPDGEEPPGEEEASSGLGILAVGYLALKELGQ